jgi:hypothetical protein
MTADLAWRELRQDGCVDDPQPPKLGEMQAQFEVTQARVRSIRKKLTPPDEDDGTNDRAPREDPSLGPGTTAD